MKKHLNDGGPIVLVISGPSGCGKSTLFGMLVDRKGFVFSVSWTTRDPRAGETDGVQYVFVSQDQFDSFAKQGGFLEHAGLHLKSYGTPLLPITEGLLAGKSMVLDIDGQGHERIRKSPHPMVTNRLVSVFITAPMDILKARLEGRGDMKPEEIERRLESAQKEMAFAKEYDFVLETVPGKEEMFKLFCDTVGV